jgi:hypothetical protein
MKKLYSLLLLLTALNFQLQAQMYVDSVYSAQQMITDFFGGSGAQISNITFTGSPNAIGFFDAGNTNLGVNAGIVITTGSIQNAVGPNSSSGITQTNLGNSDSDLDSLIPGFNTLDASIIEFDIVPDNDTLYFKYVFGSEEYNEFVNSSFNDVFGFFISGPGINGVKNLALVPDTNIAVAINNVNCGSFSQYYYCNDYFNSSLCASCPLTIDSNSIEYDGFTTNLRAASIVTPGETYHIKIAIADAGDQVLDSGVFIDIESLDGGNNLPLIPNFTSLPLTTNNIQFNFIGQYASQYYWNFGDGTFSTEKNPAHLFNDLDNNVYTVKLIASNFSTTDSFTTQVGSLSGFSSPLKNQFSMYPNPGKDNVTIKLGEINTGILTIYDAIGRVFLSKNVSQSLNVNVQDWSKGIYTVKIQSGSDIYIERLIIK